MTNPEPPAPMAVTVEQIDKDAACDLLRTMGVDIGGITLHWASNAMARHRLTQQSAATGGEVPSGFVAVPVEPTQQMLAIAPNNLMSATSLSILWRDMLAAAPKPTHPNDMARENERLREALAAIRDWQLRDADNNPNIPENFKGSPFDYLRKMANDALKLSTTPSNPPASTES